MPPGVLVYVIGFLADVLGVPEVSPTAPEVGRLEVVARHLNADSENVMEVLLLEL